MKMYILIRDDLSKSQQAVQGGHALAAFMLSYPDLAQEWGNHTIVYLKTNFEMLTMAQKTFPLADINIASFYEPDIGSQLTAFAAYGPDCSEYFKDFRLL
jgi:hypothetical protein